MKTLVQPRPIVSIDDQIKQLRSKPVRNAKRVYAGIKVRSQSHNDLLNQPAIVLEPQPHYNTIETGLPFDEEEGGAEIITKDDLFICVSIDEGDGNPNDQVPKKRRRSTGNITPKEINLGVTEAQIAERTVHSTDSNTVVSDSSSTSSSDEDKDVEQQEQAFGSVFEDYETGLDIDWREQLWCLTESLSFDATISDKHKAREVAAASEIPATPLAAALATLQGVI